MLHCLIQKMCQIDSIKLIWPCISGFKPVTNNMVLVWKSEGFDFSDESFEPPTTTGLALGYFNNPKFQVKFNEVF